MQTHLPIMEMWYKSTGSAKPIRTRGEERREKVRCMERGPQKFTRPHVRDSQWGFALWLRKLKQGLCNSLKGGMRREMGGRAYGCTHGWFLLMYIPAKHLLLLHWPCYKAFDCVDHNKLWKILKEMEIPNYLLCILSNLYAGQEAIVRTQHGRNGWVQNWERSTSRLYNVTLLT